MQLGPGARMSEERVDGLHCTRRRRLMRAVADGRRLVEVQGTKIRDILQAI